MKSDRLLGYKGTSFHDISPKDVHCGDHYIKAFIVYLEVPVEDDTGPNLYKMEPPVKIVSKVASVFRQFESLLYGIVRNEIGQFWLQNSHEVDLLSDSEILANIRILNTEEKWVQFYNGSIPLKGQIPFPDELINKQRWFQIKELLENNYKPDLSLVFFRNAQAYFRKNDFRFAIVEACIALERAISKFIPSFIATEIRKEYSSVLQGDSLSKKVEILLPLLVDGLIVNNKIIETCKDAVNLRNQVIHRSRVKLTKKVVRDSLKAIKSILDKLNPREFEIVDEGPLVTKRSV